MLYSIFLLCKNIHFSPLKIKYMDNDINFKYFIINLMILKYKI